MKPLKLYLNHFIGVKAGLGLDEITVDFEKLSPDSGLIAFVGPNGAGKSTLLDNAHPYRLMPSRANGFTPGSFSYFDNIYDTEAQKTLEWSHNGQRYRTSLVFKVSDKTKKQVAYLHTWNNGQWTPAQASDGTVSNGNTKTYDQVLCDILGSPEMFFTSVFAAQNKRHLSSYNNGEIKSLLSELLGLDYVHELGDKAKAVTKQLIVQLDALRDDIERVASAEHEHTLKRTEHAQLSVSHQTQISARQQTRQLVIQATRELADLQAADNNNTDIEIRRNTLIERLKRIESQLEKQLNELDHDIRMESINMDDARSFCAHENFTADKAINDLRQNITQHQKILNQSDLIEAAGAQATLLADKLSAATQDVKLNKENAATYRQLTNEANRLDGQLNALSREIAQYTDKLADLEKRSQLINEVPCRESGFTTRCSLLSNALDANAAISGTIKERETKQTQYNETLHQKQAMFPVLKSLENIETILQASEEDVHTIQAEIAENNRLAALGDTLANTQSAIQNAMHQIHRIEASRKSREDELEKSKEKSKLLIQTLELRKKTLVTDADEERKHLSFELGTLPQPVDTQAIEQAESVLAQADTSLTDIEHTVESLQARIATLEAELSTLSKALGDAEYVKRLSARIEDEITHWRMLAKALGKDGIIALSIDDAGPTLAALANELLLACFGPRFTVRLDTQSQTASGDLRETFDITVFDAERNDKKSVSALSGGEKIWINEAITRAIALYQSQQSGQHYSYLFADETDGPLDPKRKAQFMTMKRKVLELGNYEGEIFISHTPELWGMADSTIDINHFNLR